jgi:hypothetical protein
MGIDTERKGTEEEVSKTIIKINSQSFYQT